MLTLCLDPGETLGYVFIEMVPIIGGDQWESPPKILTANQIPLETSKEGFNWEMVSQEVSDLFAQEPDVVVIEDYRVYGSTAMAHVGSRVLTSELIGAICHEAAISQTPVCRLMAGAKGSWPAARIMAKFPKWKIVPQPHAGDALILGLVYAENVLGWKP